MSNREQAVDPETGLRPRVDMILARLEDQVVRLADYAPLNEAEQARAAELSQELLELAPQEKGR